MNDWDAINLVMSFRSVGLSESTVKYRKRCLLLLKEFCEGTTMEAWADFNEQQATRFIAYLQNRRLSERTVYDYAITALGCVEMLQQLKPGVVHPGFVIPHSKLPQFAVSYHSGVLNEGTIRTILTAAKADIISGTYSGVAANIPYLLLLAIHTVANPSCLVRLQRDCLSWHPDGSADLIWSKPRANRELRQRHSAGDFGVLDLVVRLQAKSETQFLFNHQSTLQRDAGKLLKAWTIDHNIRPFEWSILRPTMATHFYARTRDIHSVQRLLHHRQLITTIRYLEEATVVPLHQAILSEAQEAYFRRIMK